VSEDRKKPPESGLSSSLSSSGLPSTDRSLERVLGAIDRTIQTVTNVMKMVHDEVTSQGRLNMARHEMVIKTLGKMRLELATLTDQLRTLIQGHDITVGATVEAKNALVSTRERLEKAAKDITGAHALQAAEDEEGHAPRSVRIFVVKVTNWLWPVAVRTGRDGVRYAIKLISGLSALGGVAKLLSDILHGN